MENNNSDIHEQQKKVNRLNLFGSEYATPRSANELNSLPHVDDDGDGADSDELRRVDDSQNGGSGDENQIRKNTRSKYATNSSGSSANFHHKRKRTHDSVGVKS